MKMFYFGPWDEAGHYLFNEHGRNIYDKKDLGTFPWDSHGGEIDCCMQPTCYQDERGDWKHGQEIQRQALLHHKDGWTAISFWDRSVDTRGGCNSTYFAEGIYTFDEMVKMAKERFSERWKKHGNITQYYMPIT